MLFTSVTAPEVYSNARTKSYPSFDMLQVANESIFRALGYEEQKPRRNYTVPSKGNAKDPERSMESSRARARAALRDLALCNHFEYFFTWTLDPALIDRYDVAAVKDKVLNFLKNKSRRNQFSYICVAERHKDGAIHFHGLCNIGTIRLKRAINKRSGAEMSTAAGQPIYNMEDWKLGFSTCIPIDENYERTCNYLMKYISKGAEKIFGKWYFSSRSLRKRPDISLVYGMDYAAFADENPDLHEIPIYRDIRMLSMQLPKTPEMEVKQ